MSVAALQLDIAERALPNGLTLLAVRNPGVATFACTAFLDVSQADEEPAEAGIANLVGECLEEGTKGKDALALAGAVEAIGGHLEGGHRGGSVQCPAESADKGVRLLREILLEPAFVPREVRRVRGEVLTEIKSERDDPRMVASRRFRKDVYGRHPLGRPLHGLPKTVESFEAKDLRRFHRRWFVPEGGYLAAAGPAEPEAMLDRLQRAFGGWKGSRPEHRPVPEVKMPRERRDLHLPMKREQVHVYVGHPGIRRVHPDFHALLVMDHVLGSGPGFTSRIARRLRDEMGLCYSVHAGITSSASDEPGVFAAYIGTSAEHRQKAIDGFLEEMRKLRAAPPAAQEVEDVVLYLTGSFVFGLERNGNLAAYAIRAKRFGLGFDYVQRFPDLVRAVTPSEVRAVAERHLDPDRVIVISAGAS